MLTVTEDDVVLLEELISLVDAGLIAVESINEDADPLFRVTTRGRAAIDQTTRAHAVADDDGMCIHDQ